MAKKVDISNKVAITCLYKKLYNFWSGYKCYKNKVKYSQYYHLTRQNYDNVDIVSENTNVIMVSKSKSKEDNLQAKPNISILPRL